MEKCKVIHLEEANTLSNFLDPEERDTVVSLKITGFIGRNDFDDVLNIMCDVYGVFDRYDFFIPNYAESAAIRHLDLGDATYVDGEELPFFGSHVQLETFILPKGIKTTIDGNEDETGLAESDMLKTLVLPEGLKTVDGFRTCPNLERVILPEGLEEIGMNAFIECTALTSIRIPSTVKYLSNSSFARCTMKAFEVDDENPYFTTVDGVVFSKDLTMLVAFPAAYPHDHYVVPDTTRIIGEYAFEDCHVPYIELPEGLTSIKNLAFEESKIRSIEMPDTVIELGKSVFRNCFNLEHIRLSNGLQTIPTGIFFNCSKLNHLEIPKSVKQIYHSAISGNGGLEYLHLNDGLEEIVDDGFLYCGKGHLQEVNLPKTLRKVPGGVFNFCPHINGFSLDSGNPYFSIIEGALCSKDGKTIYSVPGVQRCSYKVPEGIEVIAERAFSFLPKLQTIELPSTLRSIGRWAFHCCDSLACIQIPVGVTRIHIHAFGVHRLNAIIMESAVPPEVTGDVSDDEWRYRNVNLFVPKEAVAAYKDARGWKSFNLKANN